MLRRCLASLLLLSVVATLATRPSTASAAASTNFGYYELVNTRSTTLNDLVVTNVIPPNSIIPPSPTTSPLTILDGSFGFDPKNLQVFLSPTDPKVQGLAINFANGGLAAGGTLNFKLSLDANTNPANPPSLQLQAPDTDLKLVQLPSPVVPTPIIPTPHPPSTPVAAPAPPPTIENTPEPVSITLWSALAGIGFLRARAFRRAQRAASA